MPSELVSAEPLSYTPRPSFRPSGRVAWGEFLPWVGLTALAAAAAGYVLYLALSWHFYVGVAMPLLAGIPVLAVAFQAVRRGHCRNRLVGALFGAATGATLFASSYYVDMLERRGIADVTELPDHFLLRTRTDKIDAHHKGWFIIPADPPPPAVPPAADGMQEIGQWYPPVFEIGAVLALGVVVLSWAAGCPYSEASGRWMTTLSSRRSWGAGSALADQITRSRPLDLAAVEADTSGPADGFSLWELFYAPAANGQPDGTPVYLSVTLFTGKRPNRLLRGVELQPEEAAALVPLFPTLVEWAGVAPTPAAADVTPNDTSTGEGAEVWPVSPQAEGRLLTRSMAVWRNVIGGVPIIFLLGPIGAAMVVLNNPPLVGGPIPAGVVSGVLILAGMVAGVVCLLCDVKLGTAYLIRTLYRRWRARPDAIASPDEPGVMVVEVIPRQSWQRPLLESADDVGLLVLDAQRRELRFEGDKERYRIPADCFESCRVEMVFGTGSNRSDDYAAVLTARVAGRLWEAPLCPLRGVPGRTSQQRAANLCASILMFR